MDYKAWYEVDMDPVEYYAAISEASPKDPQATARTRDADLTIPGEAREKLYNVSAEVKNLFHELGTPMPPLLEGCTVLDLGAGTGRDTFIAAQLVGPKGKVIAVEPDAKRLAVAEKYLDREMEQFGYDEPNVELHAGVPEDLSFVPDDSIDVVISNVTFNLSPDKDRYVKEVKRVLKPNGEWYFTDVFTDRRIPQDVAKDIEKRALRLAGAMYINDFRRLAQANGFNDPRYPLTFKAPLTEDEQALFPDVAFATITARLLNSDWTEDVCESFGEKVTYKGNLADYPDAFLFDYNIKFPAGVECEVCNNVGALHLTRYADAFEYSGNHDKHIGDTHGDHIIKPAPDFTGVRDEDDLEIQASCC